MSYDDFELLAEYPEENPPPEVEEVTYPRMKEICSVILTAVIQWLDSRGYRQHSVTVVPAGNSIQNLTFEFRIIITFDGITRSKVCAITLAQLRERGSDSLKRVGVNAARDLTSKS